MLGTKWLHTSTNCWNQEVCHKSSSENLNTNKYGYHLASPWGIQYGALGNIIWNQGSWLQPSEIFSSTWNSYTGEWRMQHNKELDCESNIMGIMKSRRLQWVGHVRTKWWQVANNSVSDLILMGGGWDNLTDLGRDGCWS